MIKFHLFIPNSRINILIINLPWKQNSIKSINSGQISIYSKAKENQNLQKDVKFTIRPCKTSKYKSTLLLFL